MSRSTQLLPPQPPLPRSLWPTDVPLAPADGAHNDAPTKPHIALPWAASGPEAQSFAEPASLGARSGHPGAGCLVLEPLDAAALPYKLTHHLSLAVALDVLSTQLSSVRAEEAVLSTLTDALLTLRQNRISDPGLMGAEALEVGAELRRTALGPAGEARAALAGPLMACAQVLGEVPTVADGVAQACAQVILGAREVVLRARLALSAKEAQGAQSRPSAR